MSATPCLNKSLTITLLSAPPFADFPPHWFLHCRDCVGCVLGRLFDVCIRLQHSLGCYRRRASTPPSNLTLAADHIRRNYQRFAPGAARRQEPSWSITELLWASGPRAWEIALVCWRRRTPESGLSRCAEIEIEMLHISRPANRPRK
jgi:hypothetical protein